MWTCKQVAKTLNHTHLKDLPFWRRVGVRIHIRLCAICGRFQRNTVVMQEGVDHFCSCEDEISCRAGQALPADAKEQLKQALREEAGKQ